MGRWSGLSGVKIDPSQLEGAVAELLRDYGDVVYKATNESLGEAEKVLVRNLKAASPRKTGEFAKSWKGTGKKYKMVRFVGNTKTVPGADGEVSLANILEYSTNRGRPFIKQTYEQSVPDMAAAVVAKIKSEV